MIVLQVIACGCVIFGVGWWLGRGRGHRLTDEEFLDAYILGRDEGQGALLLELVDPLLPPAVQTRIDPSHRAK